MKFSVQRTHMQNSSKKSSEAKRARLAEQSEFTPKERLELKREAKHEKDAPIQDILEGPIRDNLPGGAATGT